MKRVRFLLFFVLCLIGPVVASDEQVDPVEVKSIDPVVLEKSTQFYEGYLAKYYPKALVIRSNFFDNKDPKSVAGALQAFVNLLAEKPWFYVADKSDGFKISCYWEFIIDQSALINAYLKKAYVDLEKNMVYVPSDSCYRLLYAGLKNKTVKPLIEYLKDSHNDVLGDFYAFSFDYVLKLFNEGLLVKDALKVRRYRTDLEFIMEKLKKTAYEAKYHEAMTTVNRLFDLFKKKRSSDDSALVDYLYSGEDEKTKMMAQEMITLSKRS